MISLFSISKNPLASFGRVAYSLKYCFERLGKPIKFVDEINANIAIDCPSYTGKAKYLVTFWETTALRPSDAARLKARKGCTYVVTCKFTQDVFKAHGIRSVIIPLAAEYKPKPLAPMAPFTFYTIYQDAGYWERKRTQDIVDAFELAFKKTHNVRLLIKQGPNCKVIETFDRRIEITREFVHDVSSFHDRGHVFVSACGAEGWGYPHHDAMAFGRPVICQKIGGPLEFLDDSCAWFVRPHMHKAPEGFYEGCGKIGRVDIKELAAAMRYAFDNQDQVMEKATGAFQRARSFTIDQMTVAVKNTFKL